MAELVDCSMALQPHRGPAPIGWRQRIRVGVSLALSGLWSGVLCAGSADPQVVLGRQLARIECSQCHVVDQDLPPSLQVSAPAFEAIANRRSASAKDLLHFITTTHWDGQTMPMTMPAPQLTRQEATAIVAYIMSLRQGGKRQ